MITNILKDSKDNNIPIYFLFPGDNAIDLPIAKQNNLKNNHETTSYVLFAIDGTWKQAKEIFTAVSGFLIPPAIQVKITSQENEAKEGDLIYKLRPEPEQGLMTTMECIALALGVIQGDEEVTKAILRPLELMISIQAENDPALRQRISKDGFYVSRNRTSEK